MSNLLERVTGWFSDPFQRKNLDKHDEIIASMYHTKMKSAEHTNRYARFPLASQVGNQSLRRREDYAIR